MHLTPKKYTTFICLSILMPSQSWKMVPLHWFDFLIDSLIVTLPLLENKIKISTFLGYLAFQPSE